MKYWIVALVFVVGCGVNSNEMNYPVQVGTWTVHSADSSSWHGTQKAKYAVQSGDTIIVDSAENHGLEVFKDKTGITTLRFWDYTIEYDPDNPIFYESKANIPSSIRRGAGLRRGTNPTGFHASITLDFKCSARIGVGRIIYDLYMPVEDLPDSYVEGDQYGEHLKTYIIPVEGFSEAAKHVHCGDPL